jgi:hypothetical protein
VATVKITYGLKEDSFEKKRKKFLSPLEKIRIRRKKAALEALRGIWEDKDTSFFDKR